MVPTVRRLQQLFPQAEITWIISQPAYKLLRHLPNINFEVIEKPKSLKSWLQLKRRFKHHHYDVLLAAQASLSSHLVYPLIKANRKIGFDNERARDGHRFFISEQINCRQEHLADGFMQFADILAPLSEQSVSPNPIKKPLPLTDDDLEWAKQTLAGEKKTIAINPFASKQERNWPLNKTIALMRKLQSQGISLVLTGGGSAYEQQCAKEIKNNLNEQPLDLVGKTSLPKLAAILANVDALVSPDSGPIHIAAAMGTPVIGLYAIAPPQLTGPYDQLENVVNKYPQALETLLKLDPETASWHTRVHDAKAMDLISVEEVVDKINAVLLA